MHVQNCRAFRFFRHLGPIASTATALMLVVPLIGTPVARATGSPRLQPAVPLQSSAAKNASPIINSFTVEPKSLPDRGGKVRLAATFSHGKLCTISVQPHIAGLPSTISCTDGGFARSVRLPANRAYTNKAFAFDLTVTGTTGKAVASPTSVQVKARPPVVATFSATPKLVAPSGGTVVLAGQLSGAKTCVLEATPSVGAFPLSAMCAGGAVHHQVSLPPNRGAAPEVYRFRLTARGPGGSSSGAWVTVTVQAGNLSPTTTTPPGGGSGNPGGPGNGGGSGSGGGTGSGGGAGNGGGSGTGGSPTGSTAPVVTQVAPSVGSTAGGISVTITGTNFTGATAVDFGNKPAQFTVVSATDITAVSPSASAGHVDVTVVTSTGHSAVGTADQFTYVQPGGPGVSSMTPTAGSTAGGTVVTLDGINLGAATAVNFGAQAAASFTIVSGSELKATTPAEAAGQVVVTVVTPKGDASPSSQFTFSPAPTITSITPSSGGTGGGTTVSITGTGLGSTIEVDFGPKAASFAVVSASELHATTPPGTTGPVPVTIVTPGGHASSPVEFTYTSGPSINAMTPTSGPAAGGTTVTLQGSDLGGVIEVDFGQQSANFSVVSPTEVVVSTPGGTPGQVPVTVITPAGEASPPTDFTYS